MSIAHMQSGEVIGTQPLKPALPTARTQALLESNDVEGNRLGFPSDKEMPPHQARGEIVVQCLEGQVAITASARTQNLHAGELLYLPAGEPHSVKGVEPASLLLSIQNPGPNGSEENETIYARGSLLSVMQALVLVISLALLFIAVASNIFAGVLVIGVVLVIFGCLHYWLWGRWMSPPIAQPRAPSPASHR
ncbi:MAG TPA: cupin domain-containing protein [Gemmataceae bacterium]|jgi:quercetin dioxygenase-like cupin family protein